MGQKTSKRKRKDIKHLVPFLDVDVNIEPDDRCSISGITCLYEGRIIVADYLGHIVKYYDTKTLKLVDYLSTLSSPYEVSKSANNFLEVFVTFPFEKKILHVSAVDNKLSTLSTIKTDGLCYGVASFRAGIAVSVRTDKHQWQIELLDLTGAVLHVIKNDECGQKLFGYPDYIAMETDGSRLYVADGLLNSVTSLSLNSSPSFVFKVEFIFKDRHLLIPKGITLDCNGDLFVIGCESNNVLKISKTGQNLGVVLDRKEEIVTPMGIFYDVIERKIFVTEGSRKIMIFKET